MDTLLKQGASVKSQNVAGETPLHYAAFNKFPNLMTDLIEAGANIYLKDQENKFLSDYLGESQCEHAVKCKEALQAAWFFKMKQEYTGNNWNGVMWEIFARLSEQEKTQLLMIEQLISKKKFHLPAEIISLIAAFLLIDTLFQPNHPLGQLKVICPKLEDSVTLSNALLNFRSSP